MVVINNHIEQRDQENQELTCSLYFGEGVVLLSVWTGLLHASENVWMEKSTYRILKAQTVKSVITDCLLKKTPSSYCIQKHPLNFKFLKFSIFMYEGNRAEEVKQLL